MAQGVYVLQSPQDTGDNTLPKLYRDPLLNGANGGIGFLFDLAFGYCYPGGNPTGRPAPGAPASGATVYDVAENGNGSVSLQAGDVVSYAGGGFDFSACSKLGNHVAGNGALAASIWAAAQQYFLLCVYVKLPTLANWTTGGSLAEILKFATLNATYQNSAELAIMALANGGVISMRRQNGAGTADNPGNIVPSSSDYGGFAQLAFWRDATGQYGRLKTANGVVQVSMAVGVNNTQNFSALPLRTGVLSGFQGAAGSALPAPAANAYKMRIYRGFGENLYTSGRSAATVLDADYTRTVGRGVFS